VIILLAYDATKEGRDYLLQAPELQWLPREQIHLFAVMPIPTGLFLGEGYVPLRRLSMRASLSSRAAGFRVRDILLSVSPSRKSAEQPRNCMPT
jgi:hypothetical protein